jgi:hypothetical protein
MICTISKTLKILLVCTAIALPLNLTAMSSSTDPDSNPNKTTVSSCNKINAAVIGLSRDGRYGLFLELRGYFLLDMITNKIIWVFHERSVCRIYGDFLVEKTACKTMVVNLKDHAKNLVIDDFCANEVLYCNSEKNIILTTNGTSITGFNLNELKQATIDLQGADNSSRKHISNGTLCAALSINQQKQSFIQIWNCGDGKLIRSIKIDATPYHFIFSPDGDRLLVYTRPSDKNSYDLISFDIKNEQETPKKLTFDCLSSCNDHIQHDFMQPENSNAIKLFNGQTLKQICTISNIDHKHCLIFIEYYKDYRELFIYDKCKSTLTSHRISNNATNLQIKHSLNASQSYDWWKI